MNIKTINDVDLSNKRVLIRADLNVPIKDGKITNSTRIDAFLPTLKLAIKKNAKQILICSHLGRPKEGEFDQQFSLHQVAAYLSQTLGFNVPLIADYLNGINNSNIKVSLLENVRFNIGEKSNATDLAQKYANLCDVFVMDAFGTAHRAHASTFGVTQYVKTSCAGLLLDAEINALNQALANPAKPMLAIVGGAKVSSKLTILHNLADICDNLIVGGAIANTFFKAQGFNIGKSLYEPDLVADAKTIMTKVNIALPHKVMVGTSLEDTATIKNITDIAENEMILDLNIASNPEIMRTITNAKTIIWNGPIGIFEQNAFSLGTKNLAEAIAQSSAFSLAGGGDTLAAIAKFGVTDKISYISTGGGAFLEFVEGKNLPAITALQSAFNKS